MQKHMTFSWLSGIALSGLFLAVYPGAASADPWSEGSARPAATSQSDSNFQPYDVSPAASRQAFAQAEYDTTYSDLMGSSARVRKQFNASPDYLQAVKAVDDARAAYDQACQPILDRVHDDPDYQLLIQKRDRVASMLQSVTLSPQGQLDLATSKMRYSTEASHMETDALGADGAVQQAKAKLNDARQALANKTAQFEASLSNNPEIINAKHAFDTAKANLAAAQASYQSALQARADALNADMRRYPDNSNLNNNWNPYNNGYYGFGYGYYGPNVVIIHHHSHSPNTNP